MNDSTLPEAASTVLRLEVNAETVLRVMYACDQSLAHTALLLDLLKFHKSSNSIPSWCTRSIDSSISGYPAGRIPRRVAYRAFEDLVEWGVIETKPVVRNTARCYRLVPSEFMNLLNSVPGTLPGMSETWGVN